MIDIEQITKQLLLELDTESARMAVRAEGVRLLYSRIRDQIEQANREPADSNQQHPVSPSEETRQTEPST